MEEKIGRPNTCLGSFPKEDTMGRKKEEKAAIIGVIGGGYLLFKQIPQMIMAALQMTKLDSRQRVYRMYSASSKSFRIWLDSVLVKDQSVTWSEFSPKAYKFKEELNKEFLLGAESKSPLDALLIIGHLGGHYDFTNNKGERVQGADSAESLLYWNLGTLKEQNIPVIQVVATTKPDAAETEQELLATVRTDTFMFRDGVRAAKRWERPTPAEPTGL